MRFWPAQNDRRRQCLGLGGKSMASGGPVAAAGHARALPKKAIYCQRDRLEQISMLFSPPAQGANAPAPHRRPDAKSPTSTKSASNITQLAGSGAEAGGANGGIGLQKVAIDTLQLLCVVGGIETLGTVSWRMAPRPIVGRFRERAAPIKNPSWKRCSRAWARASLLLITAGA
jgi:hypothetical protein